MRSSQDNKEEKPKRSKGGKTTAPRTNEAPSSQSTMARPGKDTGRASQPSEPVITEHEFRALVARKAYELYEHRRASTDVEDWLQAEQLVKQQLHAQG